MQAFTARLCYTVKPLSWNAITSKWGFWKKIKFPNVWSKVIEILIGGHNVDYYSAEKEIAGEPNKLVS